MKQNNTEQDFLVYYQVYYMLVYQEGNISALTQKGVIRVHDGAIRAVFMTFYPFTNFEIQAYYQNDSRFNV